MNNPDKDFVCRTKEILGTEGIKHDFSLLINCALGLVIFPQSLIEIKYKEKNKGKTVKETKTITIEIEESWLDDPFWKKSLRSIDDLPECLKTKMENSKFPKTLGSLLKTLRNVFGHQRLRPVNENGKFTGLNLMLGNKYKFTQDELKLLLEFIADKYLLFMKENCAND